MHPLAIPPKAIARAAARDAAMTKFHAIVVADRHAADDDASPANSRNSLGEVMTAGRVIERLRTGAAGPAAA